MDRLAVMDVRLILDDPADGAWNMAVDEALLESAVQGGPPTLRIYRWKTPTLSLGYFQASRERETHAPSRTSPLVRRHSGGGAILHDRELTYSFTGPIGDRTSSDVASLYRAMHGAIVQSLQILDIPAELRESASATAGKPEPFLCFQRQAGGDVVLQGRKICGSAQRRRKHAVLQHGSILLAKSDFAPELVGIKELANCSPDQERFLSEWLNRAQAALGWRLDLQELTTAEADLASAVAAEKFETSRWTLLR